MGNSVSRVPISPSTFESKFWPVESPAPFPNLTSPSMEEFPSRTIEAPSSECVAIAVIFSTGGGPEGPLGCPLPDELLLLPLLDALLLELLLVDLLGVPAFRVTELVVTLLTLVDLSPPPPVFGSLLALSSEALIRPLPEWV